MTMNAETVRFEPPPGRSPQRGVPSIVADAPGKQPSQRYDLQSFLAFSALHDQARRSATRNSDKKNPSTAQGDLGREVLFSLGEVLQLVAERALEITRADGLAIAFAEGTGIGVRAHAGEVRPDAGQCIDSRASFSSACLRTGKVLICNDSEKDARVNLVACRSLAARSIAAIPLRGRYGVVGVFELFSKQIAAFNDNAIRKLMLLAELITAALVPDEEQRFAKSVQALLAKLDEPPSAAIEPVANPTLPTYQIEPSSSSPIIAPETTADRDKPAPVSSTVIPLRVDFGGQSQLRFTETITPSTSTRDSYRPSSWFLMWSVVIAAAFVLGFSWRNRNPPTVGAMGLTLKVESQRLLQSPIASPPAVAPSVDPVKALPESDSAGTPKSLARELVNLPRVTGIQHWSEANASRVVIACESQLQYEAHRLTDPDRIFFDFPHTHLAAGLAGESVTVDDPVLKQIRVAQTVVGVTRVVLETKGKALYSAKRELNPSELIIELRTLHPTEH